MTKNWLTGDSWDGTVDTLDLGAEIPDVQRLRLEPGDVLVVIYNQPIHVAEKERIVETIKQVLPNNRALVFERGEGIRLAVLGPGE